MRNGARGATGNELHDRRKERRLPNVLRKSTCGTCVVEFGSQKSTTFQSNRTSGQLASALTDHHIEMRSSFVTGRRAAGLKGLLQLLEVDDSRAHIHRVELERHRVCYARLSLWILRSSGVVLALYIGIPV